MKIDNDLIAYLENLSYITLPDEEKQRLTGDLKDILGNMAQLSQIDTENVPERSHPFDNTNVFRDDEIHPSFPRELILKNAPDKSGEMFIVPKTIE